MNLVPVLTRLQLHPDHAMENVSSMVSQGSQVGGPDTNKTPGLLEHGSRLGGVRLSSHHQEGSQDEIRRLVAFRRGRPKVGELSSGAVKTLQSGWAEK